jgi:two-component system phosphate regulon sensor histidine kinase PhoR
VHEVISQILLSLEPQLRQKGYTIDFETGETPLPPVKFDAEAIRQVLINLVDNAVKYSPNEKRIAVSLSAQNGGVALKVRDWGIGIDASERKKIFEKFHRVGNNLTHDVKGSGLGLAIVQHIVSAHEGYVEVEGAKEKGSTFTVYLPSDSEDKK